MGTGFEHTALAIFTTLAPMAAMSFIALMYAVSTNSMKDQDIKRLDKWTALPLVILVIGFLGAFTHLASPLNAASVLTGIGRSPLSNEICVGIVFTIAVVLYWLLALAGKLTRKIRIVFLAIVSLLAVVFAVFCGLAYMMHTIPTWDTPMSIVQMVGYALTGGTVLGFLTLGCAKIEMPSNAAVFAAVLSLVGVIIGALGFGIQLSGLSDIRNIWGSADALVPYIWGIYGSFILCGVVSSIVVYIAGKRAFSPALMALAFLIIAVGVFFARIGFYGLFMGIAL